MGSKLDEANDWLAKAEKCMKTSFFKRSPDYDSAIEYYTKAALIFRNCKQLKQAADLYKKIAELNMKLGSYFHCAKNYETASLLYRDLKEFDTMTQLITEAGHLLRVNGTPDSASYVYQRAAKSLEQPLPAKAAEFYELSASACEVEEKYHEAADQCNNAARLWVRIDRLSDAERVLRLYVDYTQKSSPDSMVNTISGLGDPGAVPNLCSRAVVVMILIKLHQDDEVAARKIYGEAIERWSFRSTDTHDPVARLLVAIEHSDGEAAALALKASCFRTLDLDYIRLVKELKLPACEPSRNDQPSAGNVPDVQYDEADEEDIC